MAFSNLEQGGDDVMSEINMVPLIDIMLVLLIIFIITVPAINEAIKVNLPEAVSQEKEEEPDKPLTLGINIEGLFHLENQAMTDEQLRERLAQEAKKDPPPAFYIHADKDVNYGRIINAMDLARQAGLSKIGFVTDPNGEAGAVNPGQGESQ